MSSPGETAPEGTLAPVAVSKSYVVDPQVQNVAVLVVSGVLGTLFNAALLAGALTRPRVPGSLGCTPPIAAALSQQAFGGLVESTLTMFLAAAYSGGGLTSTATAPNDFSLPGKATLIASLFFVSTCHAWSKASMMAASAPGASVGLVRLLILVSFGVSIAIAATTGYYVGSDKANVSSTVLVPRLKLAAIPAGLRWSIVALGMALPWALWVVFVVMAIVASASNRKSEKVFQFGSEAPPSTGAIVSTVTILYLGLKLPYEISSMLQGPRPPTLHSALAWARFAYSVLLPILVLGSARRFKAALIAAFMCCNRRKRAVAPPEADQGVRGELEEFSETEQEQAY
ncbi:uncharacterized protein LOC132198017 isoform X2 [Neocloeon triangulifer]|uniref:uncharacterized protein LOC132198017 isoform X2 n=1 Tax=Neocloeon triangulifer TaxID=2078957 RepID=UPI00286F1930|nr:uncharacterized protein LOC132198017 isoform X2 [Neocloeon triangulifer]